MHKIINMLISVFREIVLGRAALYTEILALRQQVAVLKRKRPRPSLRKADRVFWVILSYLWPGWRHALVIVRPETVIGWHRKGFRLFWTWKSRRGKPGRPPVSREIRDLVREMSRENTLWGAPRIHGELLKLGFSISQAAVSKYMVHYPSPPSQAWRTFLTNHADCLASIDCFVVPTATFRLLFGFIVLHHERRQIVHSGATENPTMAWVAQQIREAFPWETTPRFLLRDRDAVYGVEFRDRVLSMGIEEVITAPRSPWQNPYVERVIGTLRRECLDHVIILNERHLQRILGSYLDYYHGSRTHLSLGKDTPRAVVGRHDGINGRDNTPDLETSRFLYDDGRSGCCRAATRKNPAWPPGCVFGGWPPGYAIAYAARRRCKKHGVLSRNRV